MVGIGNIMARDDQVQHAADIAAAERDIARLRYATVRDEEHRARIQRAIEVHERHLARMRAAA